MNITNNVVLSVLRRIPERPEQPMDGISVRRERLPGAPGTPDIPVVLYESPSRAPGGGALLWIHGGGRVFGSVDDCSAALAWTRRSWADLGIDPARVAVGGASAGGGLAAELAQRSYDEGSPPAFQLLVYPMLDDRTVRVDPDGRGRLSWSPASNCFTHPDAGPHRPGLNRACGW